MRNGEIIVGLDIGTTKICAVVGELMPSGQINIKGFGEHASQGLKKGMINNIDATVSSIKQAVQEAESLAGCEISNVVTGIAGSHIQGFNSHGLYAIKGREVTSQDKERAMEVAKANKLTSDREVLHVLVQEYILDGQEGIKDPVGMTGVRLEVKVHMVTGAVTSAHNLIKCCNQAGLEVTDIVLQSLASAEAVLSNEERNLGAILLDFGGGTIDLAVFADESIKYTASLPYGGSNITTDLALYLRTPMAAAEQIKIQYGVCLASMVGKDETLLVAGLGGREPWSIKREHVARVIELRTDELLTLARQQLEDNGYSAQTVSGLVLTGGACLLEGLPEMSEQIFALPSRRGYPRKIEFADGGLQSMVDNPKFATAVGLMMSGARTRSARKFRIYAGNFYNRILARMRRFFSDIF
jgi:cell division protein FtsA